MQKVVSSRTIWDRPKELGMQGVFRTIPVLIVCAFPDGALEFLNQGWTEYTGSRLGDLAKWGWQSVIHPDDLSRFTDESSAARAAGRPFHHEARIRGADRQYRWFSISNTPLRDENYQIVRWYGTAYHIDDHKRAVRAHELRA